MTGFAHHVSCRCDWCLEQLAGGGRMDDPRTLANVGATSVRSQGLIGTLLGLQTMGSTPMGMSEEQYKHMLRGVVRQMNKDAATKT